MTNLTVSAEARATAAEQEAADGEKPYWQQRQETRLAAIPEIYKTRLEQLAYELALRMEDPRDTFKRHGYDEDASLRLIESPAFSQLLAKVEREVLEKGLSFSTKARVIAEDLLQHAYEMATDEFAPSSVRADLIKWFAKVAGLEPKEKDGPKGAVGGFNLSITFSGAAPTQAHIVDGQVVDAEVVPPNRISAV